MGDYALALWDGPTETLILARDAIGVRPLHIATTDRLVLFATDLRAILATGLVSREIDEVAIVHLFHANLLFRDTESTSYREIRRVPAAHCLEIDAAGSRRRRCWSLDPEREMRLGSDEEYAAAFRAAFATAVARRIPASGAVGATLSGGLDSSSITCVAMKYLPSADGRTLANCPHTNTAPCSPWNSWLSLQAEKRRFISPFSLEFILSQNLVPWMSFRPSATNPSSESTGCSQAMSVETFH